ncbi:Serine/threonine-protein phosphatase 6 regulatory ankyrin repeat subunit B-like protein [Cladobotryum mycophilum]|uniref:Serine/threonine-protein phosphatase 6 regulatory ankyrin repeat subunit B-like protein n=1 Tax=Cladobotryum mycophilum TaxID=491253 RepID=A0ABR0SXJ2_9HYPO
MSKRSRDGDDDTEQNRSKKAANRGNGVSSLTQLTHKDYVVGWICALPKEQTAAIAMLDQRHITLRKPPNDPNTYTLGSIGGHNIVIACLPMGKIGTVSAATAATSMISTFPSIKFGLMVGIGGGVPPKVRLGDVVVSVPGQEYPALTRLQTEHEMSGSRIPTYLEELGKEWPRLAPKYLKSESLKELLFKADAGHVENDEEVLEITEDEGDDVGEDALESCQLCDHSKLVKRRSRGMRIHYGIVASGNQVIKDAVFRDNLNSTLGGKILCVEMEAAGLMNNFPCLVIRGICDYADSHKNKAWQEHAAAVAAGFAKELLEYTQPSDIDLEHSVKDKLNLILEETHAVRSTLNKREDRELLDWLTSLDYGPQHSDFLKIRQGGSGIPGAGKTILASIVVDDLMRDIHDYDSIGLAYIYCNFQRQQEQNINHMVASLVKQLAQHQPTLPHCIKTLHDVHRKKRTRPSLEELLDTLKMLSQAYSKIFIVVDALDECELSSGCLSRFVSELFELKRKHGVNILATSRFTPEIEKRFDGSAVLEIRADEGDVRKYLEEHMQELPSVIKDNEKLQSDIIQKISNSIRGMFLLAKIYLDSLRDKFTFNDVQDALCGFHQKSDHNLNDILSKAYDMAMDRVTGQMRGYKDLAFKVLSWISHARRPLRTLELQHALGIKPGKHQLDKHDLPQITDMISACAGLVIIDDQSDIIRLVHFTTQEYFEQTSKRWFPTAQTDLTKIYANKLHGYATVNWACHAKASPICQEVVDFLECESKVDEYCQSIDLSEDFEQMVIRRRWKCSGPHLAAYFGLAHTVERLVSVRGPNAQDTLGRTPLLWAAKRHHEDVVELLLKHGANPDVSDRWGHTPLSYAARDGRKLIVQHLLDRDADCMASHRLNLKLVDLDWQPRGQHPLLEATTSEHEATVRLLLEKKQAIVDVEDKDCRTSLSLATKSGHESMASLLINKGAAVNHKDKSDQTPLLFAVEKGHESTTRILMDAGASLESRIKYYDETPLSLAASKGFEAITRLLVNRGASIHHADGCGRTPLSLAAMNGYSVVTNFLVNNGALIDHSDQCGQTPLSLAAMNGFETVACFLVERGAEVDHIDRDGRTPLSLAAIGGFGCLIHFFINKGAAIDHQDVGGKTPLALAIDKGDETIVRVLISKGASMDLQDSKGQTPFALAAKKGYETLVRLFIDKGALIDLSDCRNWELLWLASKRCFKTTRHLVIEKVASIDPQSAWIGQGLSQATEKECQTILKMLINMDAPLNISYPEHRYLISLAIQNDSKTILRSLLSKVCFIGCSDDDFWKLLLGAINKQPAAIRDLLIDSWIDSDKEKQVWTLLHLAVEGDHKSIVLLVLNRLTRQYATNQSILSIAIWEGSKKVIQFLIENLDSLDFKTQVSLSFTIRRRFAHPEALIQLLIDKGTPVDSAGRSGKTPLMLAAEYGSKGTAELLLDRGASVEGAGDKTPLMLAAEYGSKGTAELLLDRGASIDRGDYAGTTPLIYAVKRRSKGTAELLLDRGASVDLGDHLGKTPLLYAVECGPKGTAEMLLDRGASVDLGDHLGGTPLIYAVKCGLEDTVKLLLDRGASVSPTGSSGGTPLIYAIMSKSETMVNLLLKKVTSKDLRNGPNRDALRVAERHLAPNAIVKLLRKARI